MPTAKQKHFITRAIDYPNAKPHIGQLLESISQDVLIRYLRSTLTPVFSSFGLDEHGIKIERSAKKRSISPQLFCDQMAKEFQDLWQEYQCSQDIFIRTTDPRHEQTVLRIWLLLMQHGDLYKSSYKAKYCVGCESTKTMTELVDGRCPIHNSTPEDIAEENYFFRLSKYQQLLLDYYATHPDAIKPRHKYNEVVSFLKNNQLEDISFSRHTSNLEWGIPVPDDPEQVIYVWCDALVNYLTVLDIEDKQDWWTHSIHIIGKDIIRHHCVIWPAILLAIQHPLFEQVFVHGFITVDGQKMSKTIGNVIEPSELTDRYGVEASRFLLLRTIPLTDDADISWDKLDSHYSNDLVNNIGNLASRVASMILKYFDGDISKLSSGSPLPFSIKEFDQHMRQLHFAKALELVCAYADSHNQYIEQHKPWALAKDNPTALPAILHTLSESIKLLANQLESFMPTVAHHLQEKFSNHITEGITLFPRLT